MSRSKLMPKDVYGQSGSTNVANGFAHYRCVPPFLNPDCKKSKCHFSAMSNLLKFLEEIIGKELPPCTCILSMEPIHDMIESAMPALIDSVRNEKPYLIHRLELIDWRTIFGIPTPDVQINANDPHGNSSATGPKSSV